MPLMPPRPCAQGRCKVMATRGGRCEDHKPEPWLSSKGKTADQRGYGSKWRKLRKMALVRDGYLCQECLNNNRVITGTEVDHIIPKAQGGRDNMENLQCLCKSCHQKKTIEERNGNN